MKNKNRAKKKASGDHGGPMIRFDPKARKEYLTGFQKRKQARRWKATEEIMQKERQDKIDLRKEHREEVKRAWRDLQHATALTNKALNDRGIEDGRKISGAMRDASDDEDAEDEEAPKMLEFEKEEDDDPFGDCEVTTTAFDASASSKGGLAANAAKLWPAIQARDITQDWTGGRGTWNGEDYEEDEEAARKFARQRKRAVKRKEEEDRAHVGLQNRVSARLGFDKKQGKGKKEKEKGGKNPKRTTHSSRRKKSKQSLKKSKRN